MHYAGMSAMRLNGSLSYDRVRVALSVVIAVVAATVALWFTVSVRRARWIAVAAAIMGVAVTGMHYTGMSAVSVHMHADAAAVPGLGALQYLIPMLVFVLLVLFTLVAAVLAPAGDAGFTGPDVWSTAPQPVASPPRVRSARWDALR
jgi:NO-binding membrane sensor protein with MHYT domain